MHDRGGSGGRWIVGLWLAACGGGEGGSDGLSAAHTLGGATAPGASASTENSSDGGAEATDGGPGPGSLDGSAGDGLGFGCTLPGRDQR